MNVKPTREFFEANGIIAVRADKGVSKTSGQIDSLLEELGNTTRAIPFYAIYPPGGGEPEVLEGLILSRNVIETFKGFESLGEEEAVSGTAAGSQTETKKVAARK